MKRKVLITILALVLVITSLATLTACKKDKGDGGSTGARDTLVIGYDAFSNKFSPFFSETAYDQDVYSLTAIGLLASDRGGNIIKKGIEGETVNYNGKDYTYYGLGNLTINQNADGSVDYDITIRSGDKTVYFSDGRPVTIDDVIFSMYVLSDPTYDGASTFYTLPIEGMEDYRKGISVKNNLISEDILNNNTENKDKNYYTDADKAAYMEAYKKAGIQFATSIRDGIVNTYLNDYAMAVSGKNPADINTDGLKTAFAMALWGFGEFPTDYYENDKGTLGKVGEEYKTLYVENAKVAADKSAFVIGDKKYVKATKDDTTGLVVISAVGEDEKPTAVTEYTGKRYVEDFNGKFVDSLKKEYDFKNTNPTIGDFWNALFDKYGYDRDELGNEAVDASFSGFLGDNMSDDLKKGVSTGDSVANIKGIIKTGDNSLRVHMTKFSATSIYQLSLVVAPKHYYGSDSLYNYASNKFGFPKGDLSLIRSKTTAPMGAGPYIFKGFKDGIITFERNEKYWEGTPKIKYIKFKEFKSDSDKTPALNKGDIDIATPTISKDLVSLIEKTNSNGSLSGNKITTSLVDTNGYGYIGISADFVNVGNKKDSAESKNLRKAFATMFAAYREYTVNSYYGDRASVIQYPISNCNWAAPQPNDSGYAIAYSKDVAGNPIYTADMTEAQKWAAALNAAKGFLKAAGYTFDDATGKFTAAPAGAKMSYEFLIPGGGTGDHPTLALANKVSEAFKTIGIEIVVKDLADSNQLWDGLKSKSVAFWAAAWGGTPDPDMYQVYHSSNKTGSNHYGIADKNLDKIIMDARESSDTTFRKAEYKQALDIILDWGVEVPVYQRKDCMVFSTERVKISSITPDMTPYWNYLAEIYNLELN